MSVPPPRETQRTRTRAVFSAAIRLLLLGITFFLASQLTAQTPINPGSGLAEDGIAAQERSSGLMTAMETSNTERVTANELMIDWKQVGRMFQGLAGLPMWSLVGSSILLIMFVVDRLVVLKKSRVIPPPFTSRMIQHMREENLSDNATTELITVCRENGSPISTFLAIVLENRGRPAFEIRTAVGDEADTVIYNLKRHIRAIGAIATLAPLLGLFGTVIGMIDAFRSLSQQQGGQGKSELLAQGISLALVATASGLGVAIMASIFYYYLQGKFEQRIQDLDLLTNQAVSLVASGGRVSRPSRETAAPRK